MRTRILGKDLQVSAVGFGCMGISHAYGEPMNKREAIKLLREAVEKGYTFFDTAECYIGENSNNEEIVGEALAPYKGKVQIATKFGIKHEGRSLLCDSRPEIIKKSVEGSLKRLGVECIDLYYQHRIDRQVPAEEVAGIMAQLIKEGKIAHWGVSEANEEYLRKAHAICPVTAIQNRYSMMYRDYEKLFPVLEELSIGFVAFSPLANGFLSARYNAETRFDSNKDYRGEMPQFQREAYGQNIELITLLKNIAAKRNTTTAQIALAWLLGKKPYIVPIPGTTKIDRMKENAKAAEVWLTEKEVGEIDAALDKMQMSSVFGGHKS
ncbi:MAG: aldo/keto reductase [Clostridia bacterium]|nr:aldo/keto reductase [Clostridia bacterium]